MFVFAIPALTPRANAVGAARPCGFFGRPGSETQTPTKCTILILSPGSGGVLNNATNVGPSILVSFLVKNFTLVQPGTTNDVNTTTTFTTTTTQSNEGHIHVFVDGKYVSIWTTNDGIPLTLSSGSHTVKLELVNDLHQSFSPAITASTTVAVSDGADTIQSTANNAQTYSLVALVVSAVTLILVAYVAFKPKPKSP